MSKRIHLLTGFLLLFSLLTTANNNIMFDKANQLYHNKNYDSAAQLYQQMINDGYCSPDLFYNAGNTYYRLNRIGLSIWCYEKATSLHHDKNYSENLALAKKRIREPIDEIPDIFFIRWWESCYQFLSSNGWAVSALVFFLLAMALLFLGKLKPAMTLPRWLSNSCFLLTACCLLMLGVRTYNDKFHFKGIILQSRTLFTPQSRKESIFLSEGIKIKVVELHPDRSSGPGSTAVIVRLPDGRTGKIDRNSFIRL